MGGGLLALVGVKLGLGLLAAMHYFLAAALTFLIKRIEGTRFVEIKPVKENGEEED